MMFKKSVLIFILFFSFFLFNPGDIKNADALGCVTSQVCGGNSQFAYCFDGNCACLYGRSNCNGNWADGCESNTRTDVNNCGECGKKCGGGQSCVQGLCTVGVAPASGSCAGVVCNNNSYCSVGKCYCLSGYKSCDNLTSNGCETSLFTDSNNCGSCGNKCSSGLSCVSGRCAEEGLGIFPSTSKCTNVRCGPDTYCLDGQCMCRIGAKNCDGSWSNGCECTGAFTSCQDNKCGCQPGFYDCDGNSETGCESSQICPTCKPATLRTCNTLDICNGKQICDSNGYWGNCVEVTPKICTPYASAKCSPVINGKKCTTISGSTQCKGCGNGYGSCSAPSGTICCPEEETNCSIGQCSGLQKCAIDGKSQSSCVSSDGTVCCAQDADCDDFNGCTTEKCVNSACEYSPLEDCRSLTPVKCKTDSNCASKDSCVEGSCLSLQCNQDFIIENHKCICTGRECGGGCHFSEGICCGEFWNDDFDSCSFDFSYYRERVGLSLDQLAGRLLGEAEDLSDNGDLRRASVLAKIAVAIAEAKLSPQDEPVKNQAMAFINEARDLFSLGNYSLALDKVDEALNVLSGKNVQTEQVGDSLWQKNKVPIVVFSSVIVLLFIFMSYVLITPKL